jgi:hypothetical protein
MMFKKLLLSMLVVCGMISASYAADKIISRVEGKTVSYFYESCPEECQVASFTCTESASVSVVLADVEAKHAAKAMLEEQKQIVFKVGKTSFNYSIQEMTFTEMSGAWWLKGFSNEVDQKDLAPAIAGVKAFEASAGGHKVTLPVDAGVKGWAAACR